jgi:ketosteroid isomerase-like protein
VRSCHAGALIRSDARDQKIWNGTTTLPSDLHPTQRAYFAAANAFDDEAVADCFMPDAIVRDEGRDIQGRAAIRAWKRKTSERYRPQAAVIAMEASGNRTIVTAEVSGDFTGSPVLLRYGFEMAGDKIAALEIVP